MSAHGGAMLTSLLKQTAREATDTRVRHEDAHGKPCPRLAPPKSPALTARAGQPTAPFAPCAQALALFVLGASVADATSCGTFKVGGVELAATHSSIFTLAYDTLSSGEELMVITLNNPSGVLYPRSNPLTYVLTKCATTTAAQAAYPPSATRRVFSVPLTSLTASDSIQLAFLEELNQLDLLDGYPGSVVYSAAAVARINTPVTDYNSVATLQSVGAGAYLFNGYEFQTDDIKFGSVALSTASPADFAKVVVIDEVDEATPLGRAEWLKVVGLLTGTEAAALESFNEIVTAYLFAKQAAVSARANAGGPQPTVWYAR